MSYLEKLKRVIKSPYMMLAFIAIKVVVYYCLIDVKLWKNPLVLASIGVFWVLFSHLGECVKKRRIWIFFVLYAFFSIIMFADTMYYNYYNQTVSVQQIYQVSNVAKVPNSFVATLIPASFFIIWDIPFSVWYFKRYCKSFDDGERKRQPARRKRTLEAVMIFVILLFAVEPIDNIVVTRINTVGFYSHHIRDIVKVSNKAIFDNFWDKKDVLSTVAEATEQTPEATELAEDVQQLQGIAKGKNVIVIQLEAFQNFVINANYHGQELTPNLNRLLKQESIYFDNYYSIIGKGNTADAEFATLNSLYPVIDGESYRLFTDNTYNGLPWKLKDVGYSTYAFHGNEANFWNRKAAYPYQGIDNFYSIEEMDDTDIIGLGLSDKSMFEQMVNVLSREKGNFFSFGISLTSHHPYELDEELQTIEIAKEDQGSKFANYLQCVHYTDEAIGELIEELKDAGLYDNTVLAFYGDHHGLNCTMDDNDIYVSRFLDKDYGYEEMLKVPCIIHVPGMGTDKKISTLGCQVDFLPTMAYLMDFKLEQPYVMGENLLAAKHGFAAFTAYLFEGSFAYDDIMFDISREGIFEGSRAWNRKTQKEVDYEKYEKQYQRAIELKQASEQVLEQDLIADYVTHDVKVEEDEELESTEEPDDEIKQEEDL